MSTEQRLGKKVPVLPNTFLLTKRDKKKGVQIIKEGGSVLFIFV